MKLRFSIVGRPFIGTLAVAACVAMFLPLTIPAQSVGRHVLHGHVPAAVVHMKAEGRIPDTNRLNMAIGLPMRNQTAFTNLLRQIYDPASANYHQYLTPEQFTEMFGPTEQDYQEVVAFAKANGFTVTGKHANRMLLEVDGAAVDVEKAFQVKLRVYKHPTENRTFYAPDIEPSVPSTLPVLDIDGLNNYGRPHPNYKLRHVNTNATHMVGSGSGPDGSYLGADFRNAYLPGVTLDGSGQTVGLVQFDGYYPSDINHYEDSAFYGKPYVPLTNVLLSGFSGQPTGTGGDVEVALDIEMVIAMAPYLSKVIVYEGNPYNFQPNVVLNRIATDNLARQISCSWGWTGGPSATTDNIFKQMAAQGQSFFAASGDSDAYQSGTVDNPYYFGTPSDSAYVTSVGGTTLTTTGPGGSWVSETVWNRGGGVGSSGGISTYYAIPTWQQDINMTANKGSTLWRNFPDVAMTAENVLVCYGGNGAYDTFGGTSCAAPLWAGFTALINQQGAIRGLPPVGFINPALYAIGKGANYASTFHDTTFGNNTWSGSPDKFFAVPGYDLCTGWGSPNGQSLIDAIVSSGCAPDGILEVDVWPANGSILLEGTTETIYMYLSDGQPRPDATSGYMLVNDGVSYVDYRFDFNNNYNGVYQVDLPVENCTNDLILNFFIGAPGVADITNVVVTYKVVPLPGNDNFANATKVPAPGAAYLSNNRLASIETDEPSHNGDFNVANSLWWKWKPTSSTNVLIDTTGSAFDIVLAVYTNSVLTNLHLVTATNNTGSGKAAHLRFNAVSNITYQIAVASSVSNSFNSAGSLHFRVAPGGVPDTNAPVVFVASPMSGIGATDFLVTVSGTANDPQPNASGISRVFIRQNNQCMITAVGTTNWSATFGLTPGINNIEVFAEDFAGNLSTPVAIQVIYFPQYPPNDFFVRATALDDSGLAIVTNTVDATKELGEPDHAGNAGGKSIWWSFSSDVDGILALDTSGSVDNTTGYPLDTLLAMYTGTNVANLATIAYNDDAYDGVPGGISRIDQSVKAGQTNYIAVDGYDGVYGCIQLNYSFEPTTLYLLTVTNTVGGAAQVISYNDAGGISVMPGSSGYFADGSTAFLTALPDANYQFSYWTNYVDAGWSDNPLTIVIGSDTTLTAVFQPVGFSDGFESGGFTNLNWTMGGDAPWIVQSNVVIIGLWAARSGAITNSQSSSLILSNSFPAGTCSFDYKVSSEQNWDWLKFYVDGVLLQQWSGEAGWATFSFPLTGTNHVLEWRYTKDPSLSSGLDAAFIDDVNLPVVGEIVVPALLSKVGANGSLQFTLKGTAGQLYVVDASTNLLSWVPIFTNTSSCKFTDPKALSYPRRFYRMHLAR